MQYLMLIYDVEADWSKMSAADQAAMYKEYGQFTNRSRRAAITGRVIN